MPAAVEGKTTLWNNLFVLILLFSILCCSSFFLFNMTTLRKCSHNGHFLHHCEDQICEGDHCSGADHKNGKGERPHGDRGIHQESNEGLEDRHKNPEDGRNYGQDSVQYQGEDVEEGILHLAHK